jgi:hypothetical protein
VPGAPESVTVAIERDGMPLLTEAVTASYDEVEHDNGADQCDQTCREGAATVALP